MPHRNINTLSLQRSRLYTPGDETEALVKRAGTDRPIRNTKMYVRHSLHDTGMINNGPEQRAAHPEPP